MGRDAACPQCAAGPERYLQLKCASITHRLHEEGPLQVGIAEVRFLGAGGGEVAAAEICITEQRHNSLTWRAGCASVLCTDPEPLQLLS